MKKLFFLTLALLFTAPMLLGQTQMNNNDSGHKANQLLSDPLSGNYTINSTQPTGGNNFNNFSDFASAININGLSGPVVVDVVAGTGPYNEQVILGELPNSSQTNTLTINGNGQALIYLSTINDQRATLKMDGTDYVNIDNLTIAALGAEDGEYGFAVQLMNGADHNTFTNCIFIANTTALFSNFGAFIASNSHTSASAAGTAANYLTIDQCATIGGFYGIVIQGPTVASGETPAMNNVITNNEVLDPRYYGIYFRGQNNGLVSGNEISRPERDNMAIFNGIYLAQDMSGSVITKNRVFDIAASVSVTTGAYGVYATGITTSPGQELLISNNLFHGYEGINGSQYGMYFLNCTNVRVYHNTISLDHVNHTGASLIRGIHHAGANAFMDIRNNIISVTTNSTGTKYCLYFVTATANITCDNNVLYMGATAGSNLTGRWDGVNYANLEDWQTANNSAFDQNSVDVDPLFVTPFGRDLTPQNPVIDNMGADLLAWVPDDFYGEPRTATPDPGAIEFEPPACTPPIQLYASNISTNSALLHWEPTGDETIWNIEWGLEGYEQGTGNLIGQVADNPFLLEGLDHSTAYDFYVQAVCSDGLSIWAGPSVFLTLCEPFALPFTETFDGATVSCWLFPEGQGNWNFGNSYTPPSSFSGAPNAFFNWSPSLTNYSFSLTSPVFNAAAFSDVSINYILFVDSYSSATIESMAVEYKTVDDTEWTLLELFSTQGLGGSSAEYIRTNQGLSAMDGQMFQVRFRAHGFNTFNINGWGLDDISITGTATPVLPGDANCDGIVNVIDVITIANYIMGLNPEPFCFENADVNGDGLINTSDLILVVNLIMSK